MENTNEPQQTVEPLLPNQLDMTIAQKIAYLQKLQQALHDGDDRQIYELMDPIRYARDVKKSRTTDQSADLSMLISDVHADLSHYLSGKLIDYLGQTYPFFYYDEINNGTFKIYFGNWWDRRLFGELDVLNVAFKFAEEEYDKLRQTFELAPAHKRFNSDNIDAVTAENAKLQRLIDDQSERDNQKDTLRQQLKGLGSKSTLPWDSGKVKEERQTIVDKLSELADQDEAAMNANKTIKENDEKILSLSKEDTILNYEKQSIQKTFEDFTHFESHNDTLYTDYLTSLIGKGRVNAND